MSSRRQQTRQTIEFPERVFKRGNILGFFLIAGKGVEIAAIRLRTPLPDLKLKNVVNESWVDPANTA